MIIANQKATTITKQVIIKNATKAKIGDRQAIFPKSLYPPFKSLTCSLPWIFNLFASMYTS
jgi:hypothetical protein